VILFTADGFSLVAKGFSAYVWSTPFSGEPMIPDLNLFIALWKFLLDEMRK
jgi:hypothetical protein